jgi:hypothetical protein
VSKGLPAKAQIENRAPVGESDFLGFSFPSPEMLEKVPSTLLNNQWPLPIGNAAEIALYGMEASHEITHPRT